MVDPDHSERLQQARILQWAGIDWLETKLTDELHHPRCQSFLDNFVAQFGAF